MALEDTLTLQFSVGIGRYSYSFLLVSEDTLTLQFPAGIGRDFYSFQLVSEDTLTLQFPAGIGRYSYLTVSCWHRKILLSFLLASEDIRTVSCWYRKMFLQFPVGIGRYSYVLASEDTFTVFYRPCKTVSPISFLLASEDTLLQFPVGIGRYSYLTVSRWHRKIILQFSIGLAKQ